MANRSPRLSSGPAPHPAPALAPPTQQPPTSGGPLEACAAAGLPEVRREPAPRAEVSARGLGGPGRGLSGSGRASPASALGWAGPLGAAAGSVDARWAPGSARGNAVSAGEGRRRCERTLGSWRLLCPDLALCPGACGSRRTLQPRVWSGTEIRPLRLVSPKAGNEPREEGALVD